MARRKKQPPLVSIDDTEIHTWFERDRAAVELRDTRTGDTIIEWWDEGVQDDVEAGFLNPKDWHGSAYETAVDRGFIRDPDARTRNPEPKPKRWHWVTTPDRIVRFVGSKSATLRWYKRHGGASRGLRLLSILRVDTDSDATRPVVGKTVEDVWLPLSNARFLARTQNRRRGRPAPPPRRHNPELREVVSDFAGVRRQWAMQKMPEGVRGYIVELERPRRGRYGRVKFEGKVWLGARELANGGGASLRAVFQGLMYDMESALRAQNPRRRRNPKFARHHRQRTRAGLNYRVGETHRRQSKILAAAWNYLARSRTREAAKHRDHILAAADFAGSYGVARTNALARGGIGWSDLSAYERSLVGLGLVSHFGWRELGRTAW